MAEYESNFGFEDLELYKEARAYRKRVLRLVRLLPSCEKYNVDIQLRKAALSITNNIAEGYGRHNWQENIQFCRISRGSLTESIDDLNYCEDEGYARKDHLADLKKDALHVLRLLNGYIAYLGRKKSKAS